MKCVLALDPGKTTGYAFATYADERLRIIPGQYGFTLFSLHNLVENLPHQSWVHIIYEDFAYRNVSRAGLDLTPVKMIGMIEWSQQFDIATNCGRNYYKQTASQGKGFFDNDKLKQLGIYVPGMKHGMDAVRHLMHWVRFGAGSGIIDADLTILELDQQRWTLEAFYHGWNIELP